MQKMAQDFMKNIQMGADTEDIYDKVLKCEKCDFTCDKKITLNKHTNTNHMAPKKKSVNNITEDKAKFYCDECPVHFKSKKNLKKNKDKIT